jgi:ATP synthase protein I
LALLTAIKSTTMPDRPTPPAGHSQRWDDEDAERAAAGSRTWTRAEAQAFRAAHPSISPWWVIGVQAVVGLLATGLTGLVFGMQEVGWSVLYGAATVVVPGALMARGTTSRISGVSPGVGAVSFMSWEAVKIAVSVAMLMLAPRLVQPLSWPALLAALVLCLQVYWVALLWRGR